MQFDCLSQYYGWLGSSYLFLCSLTLDFLEYAAHKWLQIIFDQSFVNKLFIFSVIFIRSCNWSGSVREGAEVASLWIDDGVWWWEILASFYWLLPISTTLIMVVRGCGLSCGSTFFLHLFQGLHLLPVRAPLYEAKWSPPQLLKLGSVVLGH